MVNVEGYTGPMDGMGMGQKSPAFPNPAQTALGRVRTTQRPR